MGGEGVAIWLVRCGCWGLWDIAVHVYVAAFVCRSGIFEGV